MKNVRIAGVHINQDLITLVILDIVDDKIHARGARQYKTHYELIDALQKNSFDCCMLEGNYQGNKLADELKDYVNVGPEIIAVSQNNMNPDKLVTHKPIIDFVTQIKNERRLLFPAKEKLTKGLKELQKQMSLYYELTDKTGKVFYGPKQPTPDNYVRAFLLACLDAQKHLPKAEGLKK